MTDQFSPDVLPTVGAVFDVVEMRAADGDLTACRLFGWAQSIRCLTGAAADVAKGPSEAHKNTAASMINASLTLMSGLLAGAQAAEIIDADESARGLNEIVGYAKTCGLIP